MDLRAKTHNTIKKVTTDYEDRNSFNTVIAAIMELINAIPEEFKSSEATSTDIFCLNEVINVSLQMLSPIVPHITFDIWTRFNPHLDPKLFEKSWPAFDQKLTEKDDFELIIQVNGKVRGKENIAKALSEDEIKEISLKNSNVTKHVALDKISKVIYVKEKLINFVIES